MTSSPLFEPLKIGTYDLAHRVVMPPLTRMRAGEGNIPLALAADYYGQRASSGGLVIAEATQVVPAGQGYPNTPGIHSRGQIHGWRKVTDAVHAQGGIIFLQLWHTGRASHSSFQPDGTRPVAPSAIAITGKSVLTANGTTEPYEVPRELKAHEIADIITGYRRGAQNALAAGFDGVEVHAANGYLIEQFLHDSANQRTDEYGGSVENRARLLIEITAAVTQVWGADRVGVRVSPFATYNGVGDSNPGALYGHVLDRLTDLDIAYLHMIRDRHDNVMTSDTPNPGDATTEQFRDLWSKPLILAGGFTPESAEEAVGSGQADAVAFGRHFIANPDLVHRLRTGAPLNHYDRTTFYGGGVAGYTDYPILD